jgi:hypothetical protein
MWLPYTFTLTFFSISCGIVFSPRFTFGRGRVIPEGSVTAFAFRTILLPAGEPRENTRHNLRLGAAA